jgi:shikimate dehydrogenase
MTAIYGILGYPVGHSRSPAMHTRAFAALGIDAIYVPFAVTPARLRQAIEAIQPLDLRGVNITLPHKTHVIPLLDRVETDALAIGAVNTIYRAGDQLVGMNTDAPGLARSLVEAGLALDRMRVTIIGAGGAARASVVGLARAGAAHITIAARRESSAQELASELQKAVGVATLHSCALHPEALHAAFASSDLVVQATSATLDNGPHAADLTAALPLAALPKHAAVVDLVYKPRETHVLVAAQQLGLKTVDGLGMLLHQGAIAFEKWTGRSAPIEVMRAALNE